MKLEKLVPKKFALNEEILMLSIRRISTLFISFALFSTRKTPNKVLISKKFRARIPASNFQASDCNHCKAWEFDGPMIAASRVAVFSQRNSLSELWKIAQEGLNYPNVFLFRLRLRVLTLVAKRLDYKWKIQRSAI